MKNFLSGEFHSLQSFLCSWSGCRVNLEKLKVRQRLGSWFTVCVAAITRICRESLLEDSLMFEEVVLLRLLPYQSFIAGNDGIHLKLYHDLKEEEKLSTCLMTTGARPRPKLVYAAHLLLQHSVSLEFPP